MSEGGRCRLLLPVGIGGGTVSRRIRKHRRLCPCQESGRRESRWEGPGLEDRPLSLWELQEGQGVGNGGDFRVSPGQGTGRAHKAGSRSGCA